MDEDNEQQLKEPQIIMPVREVDEKTRQAIDKQLEKNKEEKRVEEELYKKPIKEETHEISKPKTTEEKAKEIIEERKNSYQELQEKIEKEKKEREIRLEETQTREEEKNPNSKGAILKDLSVVAAVLAVILGIGLLFSGNIIAAVAVILGGAILTLIAMGVAEEIKLLQLIYDLMYFERYGRKRK